MNKTGINSDKITKGERIKRENVSSLSIANYGNTDMMVTLNDVTEMVPPYDAVNKYARSFQLPGDGTFCDIDMVVDFAGGSGEAVLRYRTYNPKKC
ncbi:hypothetical protein ACI6PS_03570 [Flavobacterium sp. PLA-1-15]|uniref:hypothetical protein n=1 Tax=Flavobacterium sp. PLA-1-15 TaxID=3380533 RepID=UPI003B81B535